MLVSFTIGAALLFCISWAQDHPTTPGITPQTKQGGRFGGQRGPGPMDAVLVKDWKPDSSLVVPVTNVSKARFRAIDVHSHTYARTPEEIANWVRTMDEVGVETTVVLTGATGQQFDALVDQFLKPYPGRFQLYCGIDTTNIDAPDYPQRAAAELVRCYKKGARGVGEVSDKGSGLTRGELLPRDKRLHPNDPRLDPFWEKCAELKIPVSLHMADHPSAWRPPDAHQERTPNFQQYNQYGRDVPSYEEMLALRDRTLERHPKTRFICCHLGNQGNDLVSLAKVLDKFPNLYVDISARAYELGRQPRFAAKFMMKYRDRVLWGTDQGVSKDMYLAWWRLFETPDEYMPGPAGWRLYGLDLPASVLEPLYRGNAKRLLNWQ
jgi:predicted TIM-barrel fold metal-dependent hydrolase